MNPFYIKRAEYVEVPVATGNTNQKVYFPDLPNLREAKVFGMEIYSDETQPVTFSGATNMTRALLTKAVVSLYFDGGYYIQVPALSLYRANSTTFYSEIPMLAGQTIVWAKSYMYVTDGTAIASYASKSFAFSVYYTKGNI